MNRQLVSSKSLRAIGYDPAQQLLEIEFQDGGLYRYRHVPPAIHAALLGAQSKGIYFNHVIRDYPLRYPVQKVR